MAAKALPVTEEGCWGCDSTSELWTQEAQPVPSLHPIVSARGNQGKKAGVVFFFIKK